MTYNLLDEEWIPVLYHNGEWKRVGIRKALEHAGEIREVRDRSPLVTFGIYRLLIAVLEWLAKPGEKCDWAEAMSASALPSEVLSALARLDRSGGDRQFDLCFADRPFFQDANEFRDLPAVVAAAKEHRLTEAQRKRRKLKTAAYLATEIPTETYKAHFWHANDETTQLCMACCACCLVVLPPFCTGVGQGNETSINNVPPVYWLVHGEGLLETLVLNMPGTCAPDDAPCWADGGVAREIGPLEGMTWQARRTAIYPDGNAERDCSRCGVRASKDNPLVRWIVFANRATKKADDARLATWIDPHIAGHFETKQGKTRFVGLAPDVSQGSWCQRVLSLLGPSKDNKARQAPNIAALASRSCGGRGEAVAYMLHSNKADFEHWQEERWPINELLVNDPVQRDQILVAARQVGAMIQSAREAWSERIWRLRHPEKKADRNTKKRWKKDAAAGAVRSAVVEFDRRLESWFRTQMRTIAEGGSPDLRADLPAVCREAGRGALVPVLTSLSAARSPLERARIEHGATALIEDGVRRMERAMWKGGRKKA